MRNKALSVLVNDAHELALQSHKARRVLEALFDDASEIDDGRKFALDCESVSLMLKELSIGRTHKTSGVGRSPQSKATNPPAFSRAGRRAMNPAPLPVKEQAASDHPHPHEPPRG